jgi:hypothetical protein
MTMMIPSNEDRYYESIESSGYRLIVFGEIGEQWTDEVLHVFQTEGLEVDLFPWEASVELRLQLEVLYYPLTQLWHNGSLKVEFTGYHNESLKDIITQIK